jgi:hypothetical protein
MRKLGKYLERLWKAIKSSNKFACFWIGWGLFFTAYSIWMLIVDKSLNKKGWDIFYILINGLVIYVWSKCIIGNRNKGNIKVLFDALEGDKFSVIHNRKNIGIIEILPDYFIFKSSYSDYRKWGEYKFLPLIEIECKYNILGEEI